MNLFSHNALNLELINEILDTYYITTGISIFAINELGNIIASSNGKASFCKLFEEYTEVNCPCSNAHLYASKQSELLGDSYIFSCPCGFIHYTMPLIHNGIFRGAFIAGPILMNFPDDIMIEGIIQKYDFPLELKGKISFTLKSITLVEPSKVHYLSKLLFYVVSNFLGKEKETLYERQEKSNLQSHINNSLQSFKSKEIQTFYPYESEKELLVKIKNGDIIGAKSILNDILGYIFFTSGGNIETMKANILELCALLSRASIQGGADKDKIFGLNNSFLNKLNTLENIEDISYWLIKVLDKFTENVFNLGESRYAGLIKNIINYINKNYSKHITLDDAANVAHLNSSYFSSLFKRETGLSFSNYINKVRINESKNLLKNTSDSILDIAIAVGFEDQSYYTKVFKNLTGLTPKEYRSKVI